MSTDPPPAIAWERVTRRHGATVALDDVSLAIARGSFVALVGASGSGKSSLMRMANRLDAPSEGRVLRDGADVATIDRIALRRRTGFVFQNIGLFPHMTVADNIAIGPRLSGGAHVDVGAELERVGLPADFAGRMPAALSGGQQQRVGIARALATQPDLLLMDEPFGALDPVTRDQLGRMVRELHERLGLTILLVTHDMAEALLLADRILVMAKGRIVADATPSEMLGGKAGPEADALVAIPREQTERLKALGG